MFGTEGLERVNYECSRDIIVSYLPIIKKRKKKKKKLTFDFIYTLSSAYIDQSAPNLNKIFMSNRI